MSRFGFIGYPGISRISFSLRLRKWCVYSQGNFDILDVYAGGTLNYQCFLKCSELWDHFYGIEKNRRNLIYQRFSQQNCYSFCFHVPNLKGHNHVRKYKNVKKTVIETQFLLIRDRSQ